MKTPPPISDFTLSDQWQPERPLSKQLESLDAAAYILRSSDRPSCYYISSAENMQDKILGLCLSVLPITLSVHFAERGVGQLGSSPEAVQHNGPKRTVPVMKGLRRRFIEPEDLYLFEATIENPNTQGLVIGSTEKSASSRILNEPIFRRCKLLRLEFPKVGNPERGTFAAGASDGCGGSFKNKITS